MNNRDLLDWLMGADDCACCPEDQAEKARAGRQQEAGAAGQEHRSTPPTVWPRPEDAPLIPLPSWDSPQRPANFGRVSAPQMQPEGVFDGPLGGSDSLGQLVRWDGRSTELVPQPRIDHQQGIILGWSPSTRPSTPGYSSGYIYAPPIAAALAREAGERLEPYNFGEFWVSQQCLLWLTEFSARRGGTQYRDITELRQDWAGTPITATVLDTQTAGGTVWTAQLRYSDPSTPKELLSVDGLRIASRWFKEGAGGSGYVARADILEAQIFGDWAALWQLGIERRLPGAWGGAVPGEILDGSKALVTTYEPASGPLQYQQYDQLPPPPPRPAGLLWRSPDGQVTVEGEDGPAPHQLRDRVLTAYGESFSAGTWAALRGAPVRRKDGGWDFSPVILLHEDGGAVTAVRPGQDAETLDRSRFERDILRTAPGTFQGFSPVGLLSHSWPPQWAFALCGGAEGPDPESRALVAWEPWRDAQKRALPEQGEKEPALPEHWRWAARPPRPPNVLPQTAPSAPLGVTLAGITAALGDEPLQKGKGPLLLPLGVEAWKDGAWRGVDSRVLAKRILYPPAGWPEELDDKTFTPGKVRLFFAAVSTSGGHLLVRAKVPGGKELAGTADGRAVTAVKLGHNAPEKRGWHPYVIRLDTLDATTELNLNGQLSRALLLLEPETQLG